MKAKNIMMSLLLVMGAIAAKASGYPPELALVSQPVMVYNYSSITVYYDVENIGDYTYRGYVSLYLDPDYGYSYAEKYVRVRPGRIKRVAIEIPTYMIHRGHRFTIMPYYELGDDLYSFTIFEYFEPISFYLDGPRNERWVVITVPPRPTVYHRPGDYRFYYDGYRPPMPPPGHGPGYGTPPPPMDPHHHTYGYHHSNGSYPATHNEFNDHPAPAINSNESAPSATVRPNENAGSMSSGSHNSGSNDIVPTPNSEGSSSSGSVRPNNSGSSSSSGTSSVRPSSSDSSNSSSRPSSTSGSSSGRVSGSSSSGSSTARPSSGGSSSGRVSGSSSSSRPSSTSGSSSGRVSGSSSSRSSSTTGSSGTRTSSTSSTRSSGTSTSSSRSGSSSTRSSSSSSSSRSGASATGSGRR